VGAGEVADLNFSTRPHYVTSHPKVKENQGKVAIVRGPLIYCLEGLDNPSMDIIRMKVARDSPLTEVFSPDLLGGVVAIKGQTDARENFTAIPYYAWANRGLSPMRLWLPAK
jgi:hypothetical protein